MAHRGRRPGTGSSRTRSTRSTDSVDWVCLSVGVENSESDLGLVDGVGLVRVSRRGRGCCRLYDRSHHLPRAVRVYSDGGELLAGHFRGDAASGDSGGAVDKSGQSD